MPRLATVKLVHRRDPNRKKIVNVFDYQRDVGDYADWKIITITHGDTPHDLEDFLKRQADKEEHKKRFTESGHADSERRHEFARVSHQNIVTEPPPAPLVQIEEPAKRKPGRPRKQ